LRFEDKIARALANSTNQVEFIVSLTMEVVEEAKA